MIVFASGFVLGLLSSAHCLGMCGPIAFFLSSKSAQAFAHSKSKWAFLFLGKSFTYALIGLFFGFAGHALTQWSSWMGISKAMPAVSGVLFILTGLSIAGFIPKLELAAHKLEGFLRPAFSSLTTETNLSSYFSLGMLWGFLPCPMVLAPALGSAVTGSIGGVSGAIQGFAMMFAFGLGTIPALLASGASAHYLNRVRRLSPRFVGICFVVLGFACFVFSSAMVKAVQGHCH